jgi:glycine hydroxymethyltransferase
MHVIAAKAVCFREAKLPGFAEYQRQIVKNAQALAEGIGKRGFRVVSGGTDNHVMLVDLRPKGITGKIAQNVLDSVRITVNKNLIPFDPEKPLVTSGIRLGSPAVTTRGFKEAEMDQVADLIDRALEGREDEAAKAAVIDDVQRLTSKHPLTNGVA